MHKHIHHETFGFMMVMYLGDVLCEQNGRTGEVGGVTCRSRMVGQGKWVGLPVGEEW